MLYMKFIISENKLSKIIKDYIIDTFEHNDKGELNWTYDSDEDGNDNENRMIFYFGAYGYENNAFDWNNETCAANCPLIYMDNDLLNQLNGLFSDKWIIHFKNYLKHYYNLNFNSITTMYGSENIDYNDPDEEEFDDEEQFNDDENI